MFQDPTFWAFLSLIVFFVVIVFVGAPKAIAKALDDRAEGIRKELDEARRLREEAQEMLATYERRAREAEAEAEAIIEQAKAEAEHLRENAKLELAQRIERRTQMAEQRIAQAEAQATKEVRQMAADLAVEATKGLLQTTLTKTQRNALVKADTAILGDSLN
ncbi:F0F1 ATP synthase subunit B family protein [Woodsholea maritima]|uniref:F0F1 ATP synthase subunit B family protein n=1 Tax=Woodsholea maritima TaxID=240237 RepID=UPI00038152ED|nr:hypothetical protein [Woodsholea maritima]